MRRNVTIGRDNWYTDHHGSRLTSRSEVALCNAYWRSSLYISKLVDVWCMLLITETWHTASPSRWHVRRGVSTRSSWTTRLRWIVLVCLPSRFERWLEWRWIRRQRRWSTYAATSTCITTIKTTQTATSMSPWRHPATLLVGRWHDKAAIQSTQRRWSTTSLYWRVDVTVSRGDSDSVVSLFDADCTVTCKW